MKDVLAEAGLTVDDILGRYTMFNAYLETQAQK
jgi:hypothetical protein